MPSDPVTYYTALHIAVLRNQPDMVELLVRHGADINRRDRVSQLQPALRGRGGGREQPPRLPGQPGCAFLAQIHESSPLDLASEEPERLPCLQRLLDLGADVNAADKHGGCLPREAGGLGPGAPEQRQVGRLAAACLRVQHGQARRGTLLAFRGFKEAVRSSSANPLRLSVGGDTVCMPHLRVLCLGQESSFAGPSAPFLYEWKENGQEPVTLSHS